MEGLCSACFCTGRNLYSLSESGLFSVYEEILNEISVKDLQFKLSMLVCWECRALLKRFQRFRVQAQRCYLELLDCLHQEPPHQPVPRPPTLKVSQTHALSYPLDLKEEPLDPDQEKVHTEPQTFVTQIGVDDVLVVKPDEEDEARLGAADDVRDKDEQRRERKEHKKKVKKKVKMKSKSKKAPPKPVEPVSDGVSDREDDGDGPENCDLDGPDDGQDMKTEEGHEERPKASRRPRSKEVLPERPTCAECGKTFSSRKTYRYHRNVLHKGENRYPCGRCGRVYQWKSNLGRHMRTHKARDTGELHCAKCDKSFASVATFRQHLRISRTHVPETDYTFMCNECGKKFVDKTRLRDHIDWEHLKKVKYRCHICNNAFKCHTTLYVHMQNIHTNKERKDNLCHVCGKSYQNASKLKYHIVAMHTSETPHRCGECGASFGWYSSLYRHLREVHYGMKVPARNVKKSKKLLRELLLHPEENPALPPAP